MAFFDPSDFLTGYDWDIDPEAITGSDGDPVVDAPDVSGAGKHYGQNDAGRQPIIKRGIYNGHDAIRFGTNKCLVPDPSARTYDVANTLICICTPSSAAEYILKGGGPEGGPAFISAFAAAFEYFRSTGTERATFASSASGLHILTLCRTDDVGNYIGYFDGTQVFSVAVNITVDWFNDGVSLIGALTAGSSFYDGDIARIIHCNVNHAGTTALDDFHDAAKLWWGI